jgi:hypothetical protein
MTILAIEELACLLHAWRIPHVLDLDTVWTEISFVRTFSPRPIEKHSRCISC